MLREQLRTSAEATGSPTLVVISRTGFRQMLVTIVGRKRSANSVKSEGVANGMVIAFSPATRRDVKWDALISVQRGETLEHLKTVCSILDKRSNQRGMGRWMTHCNRITLLTAST